MGQELLLEKSTTAVTLLLDASRLQAALINLPLLGRTYSTAANVLTVNYILFL